MGPEASAANIQTSPSLPRTARLTPMWPVTLLVALLGCLAATPVGADPLELPDDVPPAEAPTSEASAPAERDGYSWYAVPNVGFDTDDGLGFGARTELAEKRPGYDPYRVAYVLHAYASVLGFHHHRLRYDRTGFGPGQRLRATLHVAWRQWLNDRYFGVGNATTRERAFAGTFDSDDPRSKRYRYKLFQPFTHFTLRAELDGPFEVFGAVAVRHSTVETYSQSLLREERPFGMDGGVTGEIHGGVLYDTRAPEQDPRKGVLLELSGRAAPSLPGGAGNFRAIFASARGFLSAGRRVVFGARVMGEWLFGEVPFYEMVHWGGAIPVAGFGGSETLRGVPFGRWRGPGKAVLNTEVRILAIDARLGGKPFQWLVVPYADAGLVWGVDDVLDDAGLLAPFHPAAGLGIRAVYDRAFVGRIDVGLGVDPIQEEDGSISNGSNLGIYVVFDHTF